jgi:hypothetical protein
MLKKQMLMTLFGIITTLALTTASLQSLQPTSVFALASDKTSPQVSAVNYDDLVIGSHTVKELKQMLADSKAQETAPITFVALSTSNEEPIYFGSMSLQQIYHQIAAYRTSDKLAWTSAVTMLPHGEFQDLRATVNNDIVSVASTFDIEAGLSQH